MRYFKFFAVGASNLQVLRIYIFLIGLIIVSGGWDAQLVSSTVLFDLSNPNGQWTTGSPLTSTQRASVNLQFGDNMLFIGGDYQGPGHSDDIWVFSGPNENWAKHGREMQVGRRAFVGVIIPNGLINCLV